MFRCWIRVSPWKAEKITHTRCSWLCNNKRADKLLVWPRWAFVELCLVLSWKFDFRSMVIECPADWVVDSLHYELHQLGHGRARMGLVQAWFRYPGVYFSCFCVDFCSSRDLIRFDFYVGLAAAFLTWALLVALTHTWVSRFGAVRPVWGGCARCPSDFRLFVISAATTGGGGREYDAHTAVPLLPGFGVLSSSTGRWSVSGCRFAGIALAVVSLPVLVHRDARSRSRVSADTRRVRVSRAANAFVRLCRVVSTMLTARTRSSHSRLGGVFTG